MCIKFSLVCSVPVNCHVSTLSLSSLDELVESFLRQSERSISELVLLSESTSLPVKLPHRVNCFSVANKSHTTLGDLYSFCKGEVICMTSLSSVLLPWFLYDADRGVTTNDAWLPGAWAVQLDNRSLSVQRHWTGLLSHLSFHRDLFDKTDLPTAVSPVSLLAALSRRGKAIRDLPHGQIPNVVFPLRNHDTPSISLDLSPQWSDDWDTLI